MTLALLLVVVAIVAACVWAEIRSVRDFRKITAKLRPSEVKLRRLRFAAFWDVLCWIRRVRRQIKFRLMTVEERATIAKDRQQMLDELDRVFERAPEKE